MPNRVEIVVGSQDNSKLDLESLKHRLTDMGKMIETARVRVAGDKEAEIQVERLALKLAGIGKLAASPKITLSGAARAEVDIAAAGVALQKMADKGAESLGQLDAKAAESAVAIEAIGEKADDSKGKLAGLGSALSSGLGNALKGIGGLAAGGLAAGLAGPFAAAGLAAGAFGAVAIPILTKVKTAHDQLTKAQLAYNMATTNSQRAAALKAEAKATAGLTDQQKGLMGQVAQLGQMWNRLESAMTPVVVGVASMGIKLASALLPAMNQLVPAGAKVIGAVLTPLTKLFASPFFAQFIAQMTQLATQVAPVLGQSLAKLLVVFMQMFMQAGPAAVQVLNALLPAIVDMASGLVPVVAAVTKVAAAVITWLNANHLLIPALIAVGVAIAFASGGLTVIIPAIALVVGGLVHLYQTSATFRQIVTTAFSVVGQAVLMWAELVLNEFHIVVSGFLDMVHFILVGAQGIAKAIDFVMGTHLADGVTSALNSFDHFKAGVDNVFNAAHSKIEGWKRDLANMPKVVAIQGNINDLTAKLNAAKAQLRDPNLTKTRRAQIQAQIAQLEAAIARARAELAAINGTTATTYIQTVRVNTGNVGRNQGMAHGGITGAAGGGPRGNWTLVGEHGMELVSLPPGAYVHSSPDTQRMLAGGGGGPRVIQLVISSSGQSDFDRFMAWWIKQYVRVNGGRGNPNNVQLAFGN